MRRSLAAIVTAWLLGSAAFSAQERHQAVRPGPPGLERLLHQGVEQSATLTAIVTALDRLPVKVYLRYGRCAPGVRACSGLVSGHPAEPIVIVTIDTFGRPEWELIALLAHELEHAREIGEAGDVRGAEDLRRLYGETGWTAANHGFETVRAKNVERAVASELSVYRRTRR
jgi:hypothetical protein